MNKELLQKRIEDIERSKIQTLANYNALCGAAQEVEFWLAKLNESRENPIQNDALSLDELKNILGASDITVEEPKVE